MRNGFPNMAHTGAARAGMVNLTMTLAHEWAYAAVRVNAVSPGWIASSGMDTYQGEFKEQIPTLKNYCPMGRLGTESEVSAVVCFLLSDAAAYITGTEVRIDGGVPLGNRSMELRRAERLAPFNGFHLAVTPKVLGGCIMPILESQIDVDSGEFKKNRERMLASIEEFRAAEASVQAMAEKQRERFRKRKQLMPRERIALLLDRGAPFLELMPLAGYRMHDDKDGTSAGGGSVAGIGYVEGVRCMVSASNSAIKGGTVAP